MGVTVSLREAPVQQQPPRTNRGTILIVEDQPSLREALVDLVTGLGYGARAVGSGPQAMALLRREAVTLVLSDVVLAGQPDGLVLARQLRSTAPAVPLILMSGSPLDGLGSAPPGVPLLTKPFRLHELADLLAAMIGARH